MELERLSLPPFGTNTYLLFAAEPVAVVIDPASNPDQIQMRCKARGAELKAILLTHGHFDHIGAVAQLKRETGAAVLISKQDAPRLRQGDRDLAEGFGLPIPSGTEPDRLLEDGDSFSVGGLSFQFLSTPGHTPGSGCYLCENLLFTGDTLFAQSVGRTDFPGGDQAQLMKSLGRLAKLSGDFKVLPGHEGESTLEWERVHNPYLHLKGGEEFWY